ncbi:hypothetical protein [Aquabacterium sp.]|uniref:hypothetical protein n=1 Tax=Aquabacterium sp. TaxID=1872578 RepID=UPI003B706993
MFTTRLIRPLLVALIACASTLAQAEMRPIAEAELRAIHGGDASVSNPSAGAPDTSSLSRMITDLLGADEKDTKDLDAAAFMAVLAEAGIKGLPEAVYQGQAVKQMTLNGPAISRQFNASQLVQALGVRYDAPSLGMINVNNLSAAGTRLWVWNH